MGDGGRMWGGHGGRRQLMAQLGRNWHTKHDETRPGYVYVWWGIHG